MRTRGWSLVYLSGTDYEAQLVCQRLQDAQIPAVVLSQRDHAFNLTHGCLASVRVLVPNELTERALSLLDEVPLTDEELEQAALAVPAS